MSVPEDGQRTVSRSPLQGSGADIGGNLVVPSMQLPPSTSARKTLPRLPDSMFVNSTAPVASATAALSPEAMEAKWAREHAALLQRLETEFAAEKAAAAEEVAAKVALAEVAAASAAQRVAAEEHAVTIAALQAAHDAKLWVLEEEHTVLVAANAVVTDATAAAV